MAIGTLQGSGALKQIAALNALAVKDPDTGSKSLLSMGTVFKAIQAAHNPNGNQPLRGFLINTAPAQDGEGGGGFNRALKVAAQRAQMGGAPAPSQGGGGGFGGMLKAAHRATVMGDNVGAPMASKVSNAVGSEMAPEAGAPVTPEWFHKLF